MNMRTRVPYREGAALVPQSLRKQLAAWFAARFCSSARIDDSERDTESAARPLEEDLDETAYRREVEAMPEQLRLDIFRFICKHMRCIVGLACDFFAPLLTFPFVYQAKRWKAERASLWPPYGPPRTRNRTRTHVLHTASHSRTHAESRDA